VLTPDAGGAAPTTCPKCDAKLAADAVRSVAAGPPPATPTPPAAKPSGRWKTLFVLLGMMSLVAAATAIYIFESQKIRREHDYKDFKKGTTPAPETTEPVSEPSLVGWLPAKCNIVARVRVAELRKNPVANRALLAGEAPRRIESLGKQLESLTGLKLDDVDELAAGIEPGEDFPKVYLLVRTIKPLDAKTVLGHIDTSKGEKVRGRPVGRFSAYNVVEGLVWPHSERVLAIVLRVQPGPLVELESISEKANPDAHGEALRKIVAEVPRQSLAWIAGDVSKDSLLSLLVVFQARTEGLRSLLEAKAFRVSLSADADVTLQGAFLMPSAQAMKELRPKLEALDWRGAKSLKVETSPADAPPWAFVQVRYDDAGIREVIQNAIGAKEP
jgi:hypothetical protein